MGSLLEDGLSYKESFVVRSYEVGINNTATVETIQSSSRDMLLRRSRGNRGTYPEAASGTPGLEGYSSTKVPKVEEHYGIIGR